MAVQRNSQAAQASQARLPAVAQSGASAAQPDVNKHAAGHVGFESIAGPSTIKMNNQRAEVPAKMGILNTLFGVGQQFAEAKMKAGLEEAYMSGIAQFSTGVAEAELQASPFTRDWVLAGFRDTAGKMKMAEAEVQTLKLIQDMKEDSPTKFLQAIEARRAALVPQFDGMSRSQRGSMFAQLITSDQAAIQKHAMAHGEFIMDTKKQGVYTQLSTLSEVMNVEKGKTTYGSSVDSYMTALMANSLLDDSLPVNMQQAYLAQGIEHAIASGNPQVYEMFAGSEYTFPDGSTGTVLSRLPLDTQNKLGGQYRSAIGGILTEDTITSLQWVGELEASFTDPDAPLMDRGEFRSKTARLAAQQVISPSKLTSLTAAYEKNYLKKNMTGTMAEAYVSGNWQAIFDRGGTLAAGFEAQDIMQRRQGVPVPQRIANNLVVAQKWSDPEAFKAIGSEVAVHFRNMGKPGATPPTEMDAKVQQVVVGMFDKWRKEGNTLAEVHMLAGMSEEDARTTQTVIGKLLQTGDTASAVQSMHDDQALIGVDKVNQAEAAALSVEPYMDDFSKQYLAPSLLGFLNPWNAAGQSSNALTTDLTIGQALPWVGSGAPAYTADEQLTLKTVVEGYFLEAVRANPIQARTKEGAKDAYVLALAKAEANAINHEDGKLHLAKGADIISLFGVDKEFAQKGSGYLGKALTQYANDKIKGSIGGKVSWLPATGGGDLLTYKYMDNDGRELSRSNVSAKEIGGYARNLYENDSRKVNEMAGEGRQLQGDGGVVNINGESPTPVEPTVMLKLRETLMKNEAVRYKAYADGKDSAGNTRIAVGVGINQTSGLLPKGMKLGDEVDQDFVDQTFAVATNRVAQQAWDFMSKHTVRGDNAFLLFAELAYQSGGGGLNAAAPLVKAIEANDLDKAMMELTKTRAFIASKPAGNKIKGDAPRQKHYKQLLNKIMKERLAPPPKLKTQYNLR